MQAKTKKGLKVLLSVFFVAAILLVVWWYTPSQKEKEIHDFISRIIDSVQEDTEYYKENAKEDVVIELKSNRNIMTGNYTISLVDYSWGTYEVEISFVNKTDYYAEVVFRDEKPLLWNFGSLRK